MTVHRHGNEIQIECDNKVCKKTYRVYDKEQFGQMMGHAKSDGWKTFKNKHKKWVNFCCWMCSSGANE